MNKKCECGSGLKWKKCKCKTHSLFAKELKDAQKRVYSVISKVLPLIMMKVKLNEFNLEVTKNQLVESFKFNPEFVDIIFSSEIFKGELIRLKMEGEKDSETLEK